MLYQEALWLEREIEQRLPAEVYPMLNVGSSTEAFRTEVQPFIDRHLFRPARDSGHVVRHLDVKAAPGVDIVGDLLDPTARPALQARLAEEGFRSLLCSNLLEHVTDRAAFCAVMLDLLPSGGLLFVTVPRRYPYHPDPIDTRYRPSPAELAACFPGTDVLASEEVAAGTLFDNRAWLDLPKKALWVFLPWYKPRQWRGNLSFFRYLRRPFVMTCVVLRKR